MDVLGVQFYAQNFRMSCCHMNYDPNSHVTRVTLSTSIEYQKEMDPVNIVEKKNDEKESEKEEQSDDNVVSTPVGMPLAGVVDPSERWVMLGYTPLLQVQLLSMFTFIG